MPLPDDHGAPGTLLDERSRVWLLRRRAARWLGLLALLVGGAGGLALYFPELNERLGGPEGLDGPLVLDGAKLPPGPLAAGGFRVSFRGEGGGRLVITHAQEPDRPLWESVPGRAFVSAARARETVTESRGSFFFRDSRLETCTAQRLGSVLPEGDGVQVSGSLRCQGGKEVGYSLSLRPRGAVLAMDLTLLDPSYNRALLTYRSAPDERFFGFGEQYSYFDLKGRRVPIWVQEQGIGRGAQPITLAADLVAKAGGAWHTTYAAVPHYITSELRSLYTENPEYQAFDLRTPDRVQIEVFASALRARLVAGRSPAELVSAYTEWSGRMRALPGWVHKGAIIGLQGGTARVRATVQQLKEAGVPVAAVWLQDWVGQRPTSFGKQLWWSWQLDEEHYPGWSELRVDLDKDGVRVLTYVNPFLVDTSGRPGAGGRRNLFAEAQQAGYLIRRPDGGPYLLRNTDFSAGLVDLTNPAAYAWLLGILRANVLGTGASGWMADFGEALPYDAVLHGGRGAALHNQYPELWARLNREAIDGSGRGAELVFFTRSGYSQSPRHSTLFWLGDQLVSWDEHDGIKSAVTGLLTGGLSGFSLNHSDVGGYTTIKNPLMRYGRDKELLLRWMELGALSAVFRTHEGSRPADNVQFDSDEETLQHLGRCARLYTAWGFYREALVKEASETGLPVARHLFLHHPRDPRVHRLSHQEFLLGTELLVAPVLDPGARTVAVYLPEGDWVHLWSGQVHRSSRGGLTVTVPAPLGQPGLFYRSGSAVGQRLLSNLREQGLLPSAR